MVSQMKAMEEENRRLKRMYADLSMQADLLKEALGKKQSCRLNAERWPGILWHDVGRALPLLVGPLGSARRCYRYGPKLRAENEEIADLLTGLTDARKTWGFGLCFLHLRNVKGYPWTHKRVYRICCELELKLRPLMVSRKTIAG